MEKIFSGSVDNIMAGLEDIMSDPDFEKGLQMSFSQYRYSLKRSVKTPYWTYCSASGMLIRLYHSTEIIVIDENLFEHSKDRELVECLTGDSLIFLPKQCIDIGSWH